MDNRSRSGQMKRGRGARRTNPPVSLSDLLPYAGEGAASFAPGSGLADAAGMYYSPIQGGRVPGLLENVREGQYGTAALQGLGLLGDAMYFGGPVLGATVGTALKAPGAARKASDIAQAASQVDPPKETVKAYKLFRVDERYPGQLFPLFVDSNTPIPINQWVNATAGPTTESGKVKSKLGPLAYRPGWHAGDLPIATHIGSKSSNQLKAPDTRPPNQVWAEVELPADVDWQQEALKRGTNKLGQVIPSKAHITDQVPVGGHYRYKTNPNMTGNWLIGGSMRINRILPDDEVSLINQQAGVRDLPRAEPFNAERFGLTEFLKKYGLVGLLGGGLLTGGVLSQQEAQTVPGS